ncbi:DUF3102 domain-containing protein [Methylobacterium brachiatum]|uniref:DUF3102 domain-containing protein n=1 Tax=Methylobacterium brachiatum TaxID=269660 RepID=UPI0033149ABD
MKAISNISARAPDARDYVARISAQLEKTIKGFVEIGKLLAEAQETLGRKAWLTMVTDELPFTRRTAEKLIKIASDTRLTKPEYLPKLPPHWTSLHELTLLNDEQLEYGFSEKIISPDAERKQITALKEWQPSAHLSRRRAPAQPRSSEATAPVLVSCVSERPDSKLSPAATALSEFTVSLALPPHVPLRDARRLFEEVLTLCERHSASLEIPPGYNRLFEIHDEAQRYMQAARKEFARGNKGNDLAAIKDAFFQLGTGTKLFPNSDGSLNPRDVASREHTYGELEFDGLVSYCQSLQIVGQYTPIADIDDDANASQLLLIYFDGNPKERASALKLLSELAKTSHRAARYVQVLNA